MKAQRLIDILSEHPTWDVYTVATDSLDEEGEVGLEVDVHRDTAHYEERFVIRPKVSDQ